MTKEIRSPNIERCAGVGPPFRHSDFSILSEFVIRHRIWKLLVMKSLLGILPCVGSMNPVRLPLNRPSASAKAPADKWGIFSPTGGCVFTVPSQELARSAGFIPQERRPRRPALGNRDALSPTNLPADQSPRSDRRSRRDGKHIPGGELTRPRLTLTPLPGG